MNPPWVYTCSQSWTPLPPLSPYHPSGSSQCTSPKLPVSCIEPGLVIHFLYDIIHVSMPFSQIIPLSLSHRVQKTVLYICIFYCLPFRVIITIFLLHHTCSCFSGLLWSGLSTEELMLLNCGVGEDSWESLEIQPVHPKGDQSCVFTGRTDVEAETPVLWPPDAKSWLTGKAPDAGKGWGKEEKGTTEDEMVGWITDSMDMSLGGLRELVMDREAWNAVIHGVTKSWTQLSNWTELNRTGLVWV